PAPTRADLHTYRAPLEYFLPFYLHPRADRAQVAAVRKALSSAGVEISSVLPLYRWSGPDEDERQAAVRYWKRAIEITVDLGANTMNSEFNRSEERRVGKSVEFVAWRMIKKKTN